MKVKSIINTVRGDYEKDRIFTLGKEYKVLADYRKRQSNQEIDDNGFVVIDNRGFVNMIFPNQVEIVEDGEKCFTFEPCAR